MSDKKPRADIDKLPEKNQVPAKKSPAQPEKEIGGYEDAGLAEPTRFGDWEVKGRCSDF